MGIFYLSRTQPATTKETNGKSSKKKPHGGKGTGEEEVVWLSDTSEKAMEERMETMVPDRLKSLVAVEGEAAESEEPAKPTPAQVLKEFIAKTPTPSNPDIIQEVNRLASEEHLDAKAVALLIFEALLYDLATLKDKIKPHKDVLVRVSLLPPPACTFFFFDQKNFSNVNPLLYSASELMLLHNSLCLRRLRRRLPMRKMLS